MTTKPRSKSKSNPKKPTVPETTTTLTGPVLVDGFLHFSPYDLARYELAQAKVLNSLQAIGLKKAEVDRTRRDYEDNLRQLNRDFGERSRQLNDDTQVVSQVSVRAEQELLALQQELQVSYNLDFSKISYDDVTGKISVFEDPPNQNTDLEPKE